MAIVIVIGLAFLYFLPTYYAYKNKKHNKSAILLINIFFGWTVIGWIIALSMAITKDREPTTVIVQNGDKKSGVDDLMKLMELKEKGVITEEEFQAKKKQILSL